MTEDDLLRDAVELLAKAERDTLCAEELVDWATRVLTAGHDAPALVTLAGLDLDGVPRLSEAMPAFRAALEQLRIQPPHGHEAVLRAHGRELARQMSRGLLSLSEGVARIEREVVGPLGHPADLMPWCYVDSNLHPRTFADLTGAEWEAYVLTLVEEAQREDL
jgi:hypothetical protein